MPRSQRDAPSGPNKMRLFASEKLIFDNFRNRQLLPCKRYKFQTYLTILETDNLLPSKRYKFKSLTRQWKISQGVVKCLLNQTEFMSIRTIAFLPIWPQAPWRPDHIPSL